MLEKNQNISTLPGIAIILGTIVGAGFASGREIVSFFAEYGFVSLLFLLPLFFILFYSIKILLTCGNLNVNSYRKIKTSNFVMFVTYTIFSATMIAGSNEILNSIIHSFSFPFWSLVVCFVCFFFIKSGFKTIAKVNIFIVIAILVMVFINCILTFCESSFSPVFFEFDLKNLVYLSVSSVLYAGVNLVVCVGIVKETGKRISKEQINKISFVCAFVICMFIGIVISTLLICDNASLFVDMPLVELSFETNYFFGVCFSIIVFLSVFSTLLTTIFSSSKLAECKCFSKDKPIFFSLLFAFLLSLTGFGNIINYIYPIIGSLGIVFVLLENQSLQDRPVCFQ